MNDPNPETVARMHASSFKGTGGVDVILESQAVRVADDMVAEKVAEAAKVLADRIASEINQWDNPGFVAGLRWALRAVRDSQVKGDEIRIVHLTEADREMVRRIDHMPRFKEIVLPPPDDDESESQVKGGNDE